MTPLQITKTINNMADYLARSGTGVFCRRRRSRPTQPSLVHRRVKLLGASCLGSPSLGPDTSVCTYHFEVPQECSNLPFSGHDSLVVAVPFAICGLSSGFFHTACIEFLSVSTSVFLFLVTSSMSASKRQYDLFGTSCQTLAEKKHGGPCSAVNVAFFGSVASGTNQPR